MLRLSKLINDTNRPFIIIMSTVMLGIWILLSLALPKDIHVKYEGIKYQAGNTGFIEPITIEINGEYWNGLFGEDDRFEGQIMIGDLLLDYTFMYLPIRKDKTASLDIGGYGYSSTYGQIYISNIFEKITILIYEQEPNGTGSWNGGNGWLIAAPCNTRSGAVGLTNEMIPDYWKAIK